MWTEAWVISGLLKEAQGSKHSSYGPDSRAKTLKVTYFIKGHCLPDSDPRSGRGKRKRDRHRKQTDAWRGRHTDGRTRMKNLYQWW